MKRKSFKEMREMVILCQPHRLEQLAKENASYDLISMFLGEISLAASLGLISVEEDKNMTAEFWKVFNANEKRRY